MTSVHNAMWLTGMMNRGALMDVQQKSLIQKFSDCVSQGFHHGISIEEAFDGFTNFHAGLEGAERQSLLLQAFTWLTESFACYSTYAAESDDLEAAFNEFVELHQLSEGAASDLATVIRQSADADDDDEAITYPDEPGQLDQEARIERIKKFLRALARAIGDNSQPLFPKLKVGDKSGPYGNKWAEKVEPFDRQKDRYGNNANGRLQEGSSMIQRVAACLDNHSKLWTASNCNESPGDGFRKANNNKDDNSR